jgi:hypothetical protein
MARRHYCTPAGYLRVPRGTCTLQEAAGRTGLSRSVLHRACERGRIRATRGRHGWGLPLETVADLREQLGYRGDEQPITVRSGATTRWTYLGWRPQWSATTLGPRRLAQLLGLPVRRILADIDAKILPAWQSGDALRRLHVAGPAAQRYAAHTGTTWPSDAAAGSETGAREENHAIAGGPSMAATAVLE